MFRNIFRGRYGIDTLSLVLIFFALIFVRIWYLWIISIALVGYAIYRALSTDTQTRYAEQMKFNQLIGKLIGSITRRGGSNGYGRPPYQGNQGAGPQGGFRQNRKKAADRKTHIMFQCPKCSNTLRLPKKMGKLQVTCPVCKNEFLKKT